MTKEAEAQWRAGSLVTLTSHVCPPTMPESCGWEDGIKSRLHDDQWAELVTEGTALNTNWKRRLDTIAIYLTYLQDAGVVVLFRPLHEGNSPWAWWGGRAGPDGSLKLYQLTHEYLTARGLTSLIWVWSPKDGDPDNENAIDSIDQFFPGDEYVDVFALDPWLNGFTQRNYDAMLKIAKGKPIAIGETGELPSPAILSSQPKWVYFLGWAEEVDNRNSLAAINAIYSTPQVVNQPVVLPGP